MGWGRTPAAHTTVLASIRRPDSSSTPAPVTAPTRSPSARSTPRWVRARSATADSLRLNEGVTRSTTSTRVTAGLGAAVK